MSEYKQLWLQLRIRNCDVFTHIHAHTTRQLYAQVIQNSNFFLVQNLTWIIESKELSKNAVTKLYNMLEYSKLLRPASKGSVFKERIIRKIAWNNIKT